MGLRLIRETAAITVDHNIHNHSHSGIRSVDKVVQFGHFFSNLKLFKVVSSFELNTAMFKPDGTT